MAKRFGAYGSMAALIVTGAVASAGLAQQERPVEVNSVMVAATQLNDAAQAQADNYRLTSIGRKKLALRDEMLRLKAADGGTLTSEHRNYLQAKLDHINGL